jgi:acyl carrier protein
MTNKDQYDNIFMEAFSIEKSQIDETLEYESIQEWDSIGHMTLVGMIEDAFEISMDLDDIIELSSYNKGIEILSEKYEITI